MNDAITVYEHDPATAKVASFLRDSLRASPLPSRFGVYHIRAARLGNLLRTIPCLDGNEDAERWVKETSAQVVAQAHEDADTLGGTIQGYAVVSEVGGKPSGRVVFRVHVETNDLAATEPPDELGMQSMLMRHTEGLTRLVVNNVNRQQDGLLRTIERLEAENKRLHETIAERDAKRMEVFQLLEELQSMNVERETAREIGRIRAKMMGKSGDAIARMIPHAINHMAGKNVMPTEGGPIKELAKGIANGVDEQKYEQIMAAMGPELGSLFMAMLKRAGAFDEEEAAANGANGQTNGKSHGKADA